MKDEIKEIKLDHFKDLEELKQNVENWIATDEMYWERWLGLYDIKALLDCITNLQEENESLKQQLDFIEEQNKYIDKLEKLLRKKDLYKYTPEKGFRLVGDDND